MYKQNMNISQLFAMADQNNMAGTLGSLYLILWSDPIFSTFYDF